MVRQFMMAALLAVQGVALAAERDDNSTYSSENPNYQAPKTPELYDNTKPKGVAVSFPSSANLGAFISFGQSDSSKAGENPKSAWVSGASFTYLSGFDTWTRFELGADVFTGELGHSRATIDVNYGFLARIGYGYAITGNLFGTVRLGAGIARVGFDGKTPLGASVSAPDNSANILYAGWHLSLPAGEKLSLDFGPDWYKTDFTVGEATLSQNGSFDTIDYDSRQSISTLALQLGARFSF